MVWGLVVGPSTAQVPLRPNPSKVSKSMTYPVTHISVSIERPVAEVYQFASDPENMPAWIAFIDSVTRKGAVWIAETDLGQLTIEFTAPNSFGILDHLVTLPDGTKVPNPLRVIGNNKGSEMIFSLFHMPGRTPEEYAEDRRAVAADFQTIKRLLEKD